MENTTGRFRIYSASAGAGKTFQLVVEYLSFALKSPAYNYKKILAITFTNKATKEMKSRILEACLAFSKFPTQPLDGRNKALFYKLVESTGYKPLELSKRSKTVLQSILHNYSDFAVSTIDSFSQRIIRAFAYELNVPLNFEVQLEVLESLKIISNRLISKVGQDEEISELLNETFEQILRDFDTINIGQRILESSKIMTNDSSLIPMEQFNQFSTKEILAIGKKLAKKEHSLKKALHQACTEIQALLQSQQLKPSDFKGGMRSGMNTISKILDKNKYEYTATFQKMFEKRDWFSKGKEQDISVIEERMVELGASIIKTIDEYSLIHTIYKNFTQLAVLSHLYKLYKEYQVEEDIMLISEFNQLISKEVHNQPAPFIYEKIGEHYHYFLIDEFQDTSVMQWHNILPLITESLSVQTESESLVVGDGKQSIYRFRGGETRQLPLLPQLIGSDDNMVLKEHEGILNQHYERRTLDHNYRSKEAIIEFNNSLYNYILNHDEFLPFHGIYRSQQQEVFKKNSGGYIEIKFFDYITTKTEKSIQIQQEEERLNRVVKTVEDAKKRGFEYREMAVITRLNGELQKIALALEESGIPFVSQESQLLKNDIAVRLFPLLYSLYLNEETQVLQVEVLTKLKQLGLLQVDFHDINKKTKEKAFVSLDAFAEFIQQQVPRIDLKKFFTLTIMEAWEELISWVPNDHIAYDNHSFFKDHIFNFTQKFGNNFEHFILWWNDKKDKLFVETSDTQDGVQLVTIHKSKGLEYEIVIMPYSNWNLKKEGNEWIPIQLELIDPIEYVYMNINSDLSKLPMFKQQYDQKVEKVILDNLNLLYVATTRAVSELYIFSNRKSEKRKKLITHDITKINQFLSFFAEEKHQDLDDIFIGEKVKKSFSSSTIHSEEIAIDYELGKRSKVSIKSRSNAIWNEEKIEKIERGNLLHTLLEKVKVPSDINSVVDQAHLYGWIENEEKEEMSDLLKRVVEDEEVKDFFDKKMNVLAETSILSPSGIESIPDRLIILPNREVKLLDFKTGTHQRAHHKQIERYSKSLKEMGYLVIESKLVYLDPLNIVNVL